MEKGVVMTPFEKEGIKIFENFQRRLNELVEEAKKTEPKEIKAMRVVFDQHLEVLRRYLEGEGIRAVESFDSQISRIEKKGKNEIPEELIAGYTKSELLVLCEKSFKDILQFTLDSYIHAFEDFIASAHLKNFPFPREGKDEGQE